MVAVVRWTDGGKIGICPRTGVDATGDPAAQPSPFDKLKVRISIWRKAWGSI
jgi:hypothetical protein